VYGVISFVDANLIPGDWAVVMREVNFLLSVYFMINVCYHWIIIPWKLSKAEPLFKLLLLKKNRGVSSNETPPIPMNSVLPPPEWKQGLKVSSRARRRTEDRYRKLGDKAETEKESTPESLYTPIALTPKTSSSSTEGLSELEFNIDTGTRRSPNAVLNSLMSFSESSTHKNSISVNPRSLLPGLLSEDISRKTVHQLETSDNESNKEETSENLEGDEADEDDFMLTREPTLFPSMPGSQRASVVELVNEQDPLGAKSLSTVSEPKEATKVPLMSPSVAKGEDVFGVGFSESPDGRKRSKRETVTWNINDIPVL